MELTSLNQSLQKRYFINYPDEAARHLEKIAPKDAVTLLEDYPLEVTTPVWERLSPDVAAKLFGMISEQTAINILNTIEAHYAASILSLLKKDIQEQYIAKTHENTAKDLNFILQYPANTAGHFMEPSMVRFRPDMSVKVTLSRIRGSKRKGRRHIYVVNADKTLVGIIELQELVLVKPDTKLSEIMQPVIVTINEKASREEVVDAFEKHKVSSIPVIDSSNRLIGVIRYDALIGAAKEEAIVDIQKMVGVSEDEKALSSFTTAVKKRLPWLEINLLTAFLAASVVGLFEGTIAKFTALAVLLPVVAGQSGNTGAQALAVTMRGLALHEISIKDWKQVLTKEALAGMANGIAIALTTAIGVLIWSQSLGLALIIAISMVISMTIAGSSGAVIPILLTKFGQDPAQSSSIFLTTVTDIAGFFSFLGIATMLSSLI